MATSYVLLTAVIAMAGRTLALLQHPTRLAVVSQKNTLASAFVRPPPSPVGSKPSASAVAGSAFTPEPVPESVASQAPASKPPAPAGASSDSSAERAQAHVHPGENRTSVSTGGPELGPRVLVMGGCSGSGFLMNMGKQLMSLHGVPSIGYKDGGELLKPEKNPFFNETGGDMPAAIQLANEDALSKGEALIFKAMSGVLTETKKGVSWAEIAPVLRKLGARVVYGKRRNVLDHAVCKVRDCFANQYGVPVDGATGKKSNLCFNRRENPHVKYQAKMDPGKLVKMIRKTEEEVVTEQQIVEEAAFNDFDPVIMEDLAEYQYGHKQSLAKSVRAWAGFLTSWGVTPDEKAIEAYLKDFAGTRQPPGPHSEVIYNIDDVARTLVKQNMSRYLRGPVEAETSLS